MNISISFLRAQNFLSGSLITSSSNIRNLQIQRSSFGKFAKPVFSLNLFHSANFGRTKFTNGLTTAVSLSNEGFRFQKFWSRQESKVSKGYFWDCYFSKIETENTNGSAIVSYVSLDLKNCFFTKIKAYYGIVYSFGAIKCSHSTFFQCQSQYCGGLHSISTTPMNTSVLYSVFDSCTASDSVGSAYIKTPGDVFFNTINISDSKSQNRVGSALIEKGTVRIWFANVIQSKSKMNGGIDVAAPTSLDVQMCNFIKCQQTQATSFSGAALVIQYVPKKCVIANSAFTGNLPAGGYVVCASIHGENCVMEDCCITESHNIFNIEFKRKNVRILKACYTIENPENPVVGFVPWNEKEGERRNSKGNDALFNDGKTQGKGSSVSKSIMIAILLSIVLCFEKWMVESLIEKRKIRAKSIV